MVVFDLCLTRHQVLGIIRLFYELPMGKEIILLVEESVEGGYDARALGHSIFTQADTFDELKEWFRMLWFAFLSHLKNHISFVCTLRKPKSCSMKLTRILVVAI